MEFAEFIAPVDAAIEWILWQRLFLLEDAVARQAGVDPLELRGDIEKLAKAGILAETEMR